MPSKAALERAPAARALSGLVLVLVSLGPGCSASDESEPAARRSGVGERASRAGLDSGALRASAVDGLEQALDAPELGRAFERTSAALVGEPVLVEASERLFARVGRDPETSAATDEFFAAIQDSPGIRAALVDYARENPQLDASALSRGFVAHIDARLTRPVLADALSRELRARGGALGPALGRALLSEAGGAEALARVYATHLAEPEFSARVRGQLGSDPARLQARLEANLADSDRQVGLLLDLAEILADAPTAHAMLAAILDHEASAEAVADGLRRLLVDPEFQARARVLFTLALAEEIDIDAIVEALDELLAAPLVAEEGRTALASVARSRATRTQVGDFVERYGQREALDALLLDCLD